MGKRFFIIGLFAGLLTSNLHSVNFETVQEQLDKKNYKKAIDILLTLKQETGDPEVYIQLAEAYLLDQDLERSIQAFLFALEKVHEVGSNMEGESSVYKEALEVYLNGTKPQATAQKLITEYSSYQYKNPNDDGVSFLLSAAYANLRDYKVFYQTFYPAFINNPSHFLANKIRAALHIKLYERSKTDQGKEEQRKYVKMYASQALKKYEEDSTLHVWIITFCDECEKGEYLEEAVEKLISKDRAVPRNDIPFYVQQAIDMKQYGLAQRFINKSREWYGYSRIVDAAQKHLDQEKQNNS